MTTRTIDDFGCIAAADVRPGDKIVVSYGIITVREVVGLDSGRCCIIPQENQPAITVYSGYPVGLRT
jgi:hypothetical protein